VDGSSVQLLDARVRRDSIVGTETTSNARLAISTNRVTRLESMELSKGRTVFLAATLGLAFLAADLYLVAHNK
jgi:hypothetical protein